MPGTVLTSSVMVMTLQRGKGRLRTKTKKDAPISQTQALGRGHREGRGAKQREGVPCAGPVSRFLCKGSFELMWALCHMPGDTPVWDRREKETRGEKLPSSLQCEPLGNRKEVTLWLASFPVRAGHVRSQVKEASLTLLQAEGMPGFVLGQQGTGG